MRNLLIIVILASLITCCNIRIPEKPNEQFISTTANLPCDTVIYSIAYKNGYILAAQVNGVMLVLDTAYKRQPELEKRFKKGKIASLVTLGDTIFVSYKKDVYYLDDSMKLQEYTKQLKYIGNPLLADKNYIAYECCIGEFGGSVFFNNRHTGKTYSFQATCATEVLPYKGGYWVSSNLAHLGRSTGYSFIANPENTYELKDSLRNHCNWWIEVDSLKDYWQHNTIKGVQVIRCNRWVMTACTFTYKDSLYTVTSTDSLTFLNVLRNDSIEVKDTLYRHPINFHEMETVRAGSKTISLLKLSSGSPFAAYTITGNSSALLVTDRNQIKLLYKK